MSATTVEAVWVGPFEAQLGRRTLIPGETVCEIGVDEARDSDHWRPVKPLKGAKANGDSD